jgi:hypothetical protein
MAHTKPFLLSARGSTRATAYAMGAKSVTIGGKTHVVWLDAVAQVCGRTYDHASRGWEEKLDLFVGCDNHTHPVLTVGADRRLHLVYGPHGYWGGWNQGRFKHVVSEEPASLRRWREARSFGYGATYASMVSHPSGLDCVVYRGGEDPPSLVFQRQRRGGGWTQATELMAQDVPPQYTNWGATIVCDAEGTLHVAGHFYNARTDGRSQGIAALRSTDLGNTWTDHAGEKARLPVHYSERFAVPHPRDPGNPKADNRLTGLAVDADGDLWAATAAAGQGLLSRWAEGGWKSIDLAPFLPNDRKPGAGPITIDTRGQVHMAVSLARKDAGGDLWGNPSLEVFHLVSRDLGESFECNRISTPDEKLANWLPNISGSGPFHPVEEPVILYTHGEPGEGCSPLTETEVYCVMISQGA